MLGRGEERQREFRRLAADAKSGRLRINWEAEQIVPPGVLTRFWRSVKARLRGGKGAHD